MKVLIVDDSRAMRMIVTRTLRQAGYGGAEIREAENGAQALAAIRADKPDLVLCDWNMPEMSGIELLSTLNQQGLKIRFGFVTSEGTDTMRERARQEGALFLIAKPFSAETFGTALTPVLGPPS
ncbi:MAG: response regulator [Deltaproteobacteria bacterium]|nr:response regulator [Deltaproteobacteria bacterium]